MNPKPNPHTMDYQKLYRHMAIEHGLFLLDSQMEEIVDIVLEMHNENPETCTEAIKEPSNNDQMKTAMQELIEELKKRRSLIKEAYKPLNHLVDANSLVDIMIRQINHDIELAESLLEKEKQQLEKAWQDGAKTAQNDAAKEIRNNYTPNKL